MYTILSARYANEDHTAAIIATEEAADVAISEKDTPELWQHVLSHHTVEPYQAIKTEKQREGI